MCCCLVTKFMSNSFVTPWTIAHQAPLSMGFPRQEYWSGLLFPSSGDLPDPGIKLGQMSNVNVSCIGRWVLYCWASKEARQRGVTLAKHDIQHTQFVRLSLNCQKVKSVWKNESRKFYLENRVNGFYSILWPGLRCFRWSLSGLRSSPFTLGTA